MYGTQYEGPPLVPVQNKHNAPCAVCFVKSQNAVLMIPAKTLCPSGWVREYYGYLMSGASGVSASMYECVDKSLESIPGSDGDFPGSQFWHVEGVCNGLGCPPYSEGKELKCVVCSKWKNQTVN